MANNNVVQNVEVYLDYATIPSLNYFLHFAKNKDDMKSIRLFGLARFHIPESIINSYPEGKIRYISTYGNNLEGFNNIFRELLDELEQKVDLNFHLNLFHSVNMMPQLLNIAMEYDNKIQQIKLNFYDDGAEGLACLYNFKYSDAELDKEISYHKKQLVKYLESQELTFNNRYVLRYLWGEYFFSNYFILRSEYLKQDRLQPLWKELEPNCFDMDIYQYIKFSEDKKQFFLKLLNISNDKIQELREIYLNKKIFIFTGTTIFDVDSKVLEELHLTALNKFLDPANSNYIGDGYTLLYKGHPNSPEINLRVKQTFENIICLEDNMPLEILFLLGIIPDKVGGFASTSYLFLEKNKIDNLIFITEKGNEKINYLFQNQYNLSELMIELGYIRREQVYYYQNLYN